MKPFSYQIDLDRRTRADHPLRRMNDILDLSFVRAEVAHGYGFNGHVSVDPVVLVKLMILLFLEDIPGERELMARLGERLDYLWFLGFGLDTPIPNPSPLSKARKRWRSGPARPPIRTPRWCASDAEFVYDAATDTLRCPSGQILEPRRARPVRRTQESMTAAKVCSGCALRERCTRSRTGRTGRTVHRHEHQDLFDRARER